MNEDPLGLIRAKHIQSWIVTITALVVVIAVGWWLL